MSIIHATLFGLGVAVAGALGAHAQGASLTIPEPLQVEHRELFEALETATKAGGKTGEAAARAMGLLKPHFEKEERFALPQLGALEGLTRPGAALSAELRGDLVARTDAFRKELPAMLDEHKQISAALMQMREAAEAEKNDEVADLAEQIIGHAGMEEKVLYPAALLLGDYARTTAAR
ncbi:MAG: hypothetical protein JWN93_2490 [Hyphomicrobiales bacterium]|nr:hypothetical protein [Hyphomicrobiales bacterium]